MRHLGVLILAVLLPTWAKAELKVGYVDLQKALAEVGEGQQAKAKLKSEIERKKSEFDAEQKKLRDDSLVLDRQASAMSEEVRLSKMKELQARLLAMTEKGQKLQTELMERERAEFKKIYERMDTIIAGIAKREGLSMVFEKTDSGLLFAEPPLELTVELVRTYNEKYPVKSAKPSAAAKEVTP